jgi:hypothetical protein
MVADWFSKIPTSLNFQFHYNQFLKNRTSKFNELLKDPEYLKLCKQYISSLEAYRKAIHEACVIAMRESEESDSQDSKRGAGPRDVRALEKKTVFYPDLLTSQLQEGKINFYMIETLRRFYERDAYKLFTYKPHIQSPMPPATRRRMTRGYLKDASFAQWIGKMQRADEKIKDAQREVEDLCKEELVRFRKSPKPKSDASIRKLLKVLALAQYTLPVDSSILAEVHEEANQIINP